MSIIDGIVTVIAIICATLIGMCLIYTKYYKGDDK